MLEKEPQRRRHDSRERANRQTCRTLLNCYIRELAGERSELCALDPQAGRCEIFLPASGAALTGRLRYSPMGEHEYEELRDQAGRPPDCGELAAWIAREIRERLGGVTDGMEADFLGKVANSNGNVERFLRERGHASPHDYLSSEQSLLFGHPFHPYPKNTIGFGEDEVRRYAPELGASFKLVWIAVRKDALREEWLPGAGWIGPPAAALARAREVLEEAACDYGLLPVHPWQYEHVRRIGAIRERIRSGILVPLGACGPTAYPTSSVRTVYVPEMKCNLKLPLDIQITNLKRNNTREQMRRTMDAAAYLRRSECFAEEPHTRVACEEGVRSCRLGDEDLEAMLTVAYRPVRFDPATTYVLASLAEAPAGDEPSRLSFVMGLTPPERWLRRYLDISLLPLARTAEEKGIHFEAHLQNSLVAVRDGLPETFIVRDLEGVSVERDKALPGTDPSGPLFYSREQARARTIYYFMVNHLGALLHAIARDRGADETELWAIVRETLERELAASGNGFARELLTADSYRAKRNLTSCLAGRGETPSFAAVRNPMRSRESEYDEANRQLV